ncbi:MAG: tetratricopeptide repeat protein [Gemmatimonadota bacterium]|jgi:tetratricopeptide (TPR) repeat protein
MARKRQKKKRQKTEPLQVELLDDTERDAGSTGGEDSGEVQSEESPDSGDRLAKAVGQMKPSRDRGGAEGKRDPDAEGSEGSNAHRDPEVSAPGVPADRSPVSAAAQDHAAAAVRPAGEPLARARDLVAQGRVHEAIELYLGILTVNPSNLKAHNNLGVLLDELKQFETALQHFEAAERLAPENVEVLANYASTLTSLARYDEAEELLQRAQRLDAEDVRARLGIGILYFRRGLYAEAEAELRWVLARKGEDGGAHYYRGEALNRLGRFDEAADELKRAIELIPDDPRPYYTLGHLHDRRHELEEAGEMYRRARRLQAP